MFDLKKKDVVYYVRVIPSAGIYELCELSVRTVEDDYFVGVEKGHDRHAFLLNKDKTDKIVFKDRKVALKVLKEYEKNKEV